MALKMDGGGGGERYEVYLPRTAHPIYITYIVI
jgi:hypothetical protein